MSDIPNPLDPSPDSEQRIRERAYHMWEQDGRPEGRADDYWERARELQGIADSAGAGLVRDREIVQPLLGQAGPTGEPIEEASIIDNMGEFPNRFTDQGDRAATPGHRSSS